MEDIKGVKKKVQTNIEELKEKYGKVFSCEVESPDGEPATLHFRQPKRSVVSLAATKSKGDPMIYNDVILKNCLIDGDITLLDNDSIFYGLSEKVTELMDAKAGELKKL